MPLVSSLFTTAQIANERMAICKTCPKLTPIKLCRNCGCVMPAKVRLRHSECPELKWGAIEDDGQQHYVEDAVWEQQEREIEATRAGKILKGV